MICGISGCLCSLIDKLFWGGSLDFLQIPTLFIFDLKDCYLTVAEVIFVAIGIPALWILGTRLLFAIAVVWGRRLYNFIYSRNVIKRPLEG